MKKILILFVCAFFCIPILGQELAWLPDFTKTPKPRKDPPKTHLFIVSIENWEHPVLNDLPGLVKDTDKFTELFCLSNPKARICYLKNKQATKNTILSSLTTFIKDIEPEDTFYLYMNMHGDKIEQNHVNEYFFVPYDAVFKQFFVRRFPWLQFALEPDSLLNMSVVASIIQKNKAQQTICFIQTCFSGGFYESKASDELLLKSDKHVAVLTSSPKEDVSWMYYNKGGLWGQAINRGLAGEADDNNDGDISIIELHRYVSGDTKMHEYGQRAQIGLNNGQNIVVTKQSMFRKLARKSEFYWQVHIEKIEGFVANVRKKYKF